VIVVDYVMRVGLADQSLGLKITNKVGTTTRVKTHAKYRIDLDFADDIMLVSDDAINSQKQLDSVDTVARSVGLKINRAETECGSDFITLLISPNQFIAMPVCTAFYRTLKVWAFQGVGASSPAFL
jgi:hypothetical protein